MTESNASSEPKAAAQGRPQKRIPRPFHLAVVGATGAVGRETLSILAERRFPIASIKALASSRSVGETVPFGEDELTVEEATPASFAGVDVAFFAAGGAVSRALVPHATAAGAVVIDKSSLFRLDADVPLVVPGVNDQALAGFRQRNLVATPNCSTIQLVQALAPLHQCAGLKRVVVATYQAVSGAGKAGIDELDHQVRDLFNLRDVRSTEVFGERIAFNALPCIPKGPFLDDGSTQEERKMVDETRKILALPHLRMGVTCVRIPVFTGHSEAVHLELENPMTVEEVRDRLSAAPDVLVVDSPEQGLYPTPQHAAGQDHTLVGRVRLDTSGDNGVAFWIVSDNLRTGAALNAVRIAETLCAEHLA